MRQWHRAAVALSTLTALAAPIGTTAHAAGLAGSHASMVRQHAAAVKNDFTFLRSVGQLRDFVAAGRLVPLSDGASYRLSDVSFPYARPSTKLFVERLGAEYRAALGAPLVVTSLTRPLSLQPSNASPLSVHPTGMAVDLRVPAESASRQWLESTLLSLENRGLIDVTREHHPSHFHVAVFPEKYAAYAAAHPLPDSLTAPPSPAAAPETQAVHEAEPSAAPPRAIAPPAPTSGTERFILSAALLALAGTVALLRQRLTPRAAS